MITYWYMTNPTTTTKKKHHMVYHFSPFWVLTRQSCWFSLHLFIWLYSLGQPQKLSIDHCVVFNSQEVHAVHSHRVAAVSGIFFFITVDLQKCLTFSGGLAQCQSGGNLTRALSPGGMIHGGMIHGKSTQLHVVLIWISLISNEFK